MAYPVVYKDIAIAKAELHCDRLLVLTLISVPLP